jgi:hypothetical protein
MSVETEGGVPPITYSWSLNGNIVKSGLSPEFELLPDNKVGTYTISCSAVGSNRDLVSCDSLVDVNGIDPKQLQYPVAVSGGSEGESRELQDLFVYLGTDPMDYSYATTPVPNTGEFQVFDSGAMTILEIPGTTAAGTYTLTATNTTNPSDVDKTQIVITVDSGVSQNGEEHTVGITGAIGLEVVDARDMFNFSRTLPNDYNYTIVPTSAGFNFSTSMDGEATLEFLGTMAIRSYQLTATSKTNPSDTSTVTVETVLKGGIYPRQNIYVADVGDTGVNINIEALLRFNGVDIRNCDFVSTPEPPGGQFPVTDTGTYMMLGLPASPTETSLYTFTATDRTDPTTKGSIQLQVRPRT